MAGHPDRPGEFALIAEFLAPLTATAPGAFDLTDDAALFSPPAGHDIVLTTDSIVEGVHFFRDDPAPSIARKALRVNLSDLACKGADPAGYLLNLLLPEWTGRAWFEAFTAGLSQDQAAFGLSLWGGDTSRTPGPLAISITAIGLAPAGAMIRRAGAKAGDLVFVSGTIGDAGAGLSMRRGDLAGGASRDCLVDRYRIPIPRLSLGAAMRGLVHAALDVSDGLIADLNHLASASGLGLVVILEDVPLSVSYRAALGDTRQARIAAVTAGDDYEIALACPPSRRSELEVAAARCGVPLTCIGYAVEGHGVRLQARAGDEIALQVKGFTHF
jgi:thiamine-monophosphate kinase